MAEERHEISREVEASIHQVRVEVAEANVPEGELSDALERRLVDEAERWAEACIADRHAEVSEL